MKNMITKLLCVAMVLCMVLSLSACGFLVAGTYTLSGAEIQGEEYDADDLESLGLDPDECYIKLEADGTGEVNLFGDEMDIEWKDDEMWPEDDEDDIQEFEIDGKDLILEYEGEKLIFTKE